MNALFCELLNDHPQNNTFMELPKHFGTLEQKMLLFLFSTINTKESTQSHDDCFIRIYSKEFAKTIQLDCATDKYRNLCKCINKLQENVFSIKAFRKNKPITINLSIFSYVCYFENEEYIDIKLNPDIMPFLAKMAYSCFHSQELTDSTKTIPLLLKS